MQRITWRRTNAAAPKARIRRISSVMSGKRLLVTALNRMRKRTDATGEREVIKALLSVPLH